MALKASVVVVNKDEVKLAETLVALAGQRFDGDVEIVVVDASEGRLDHLRTLIDDVNWIGFTSPSDKRVTIAEQRNQGVAASQGDVIAFIDAGCTPVADWLARLTAPIHATDETVTVGVTKWVGEGNVYDSTPTGNLYLEDAPTINLAFTREAFNGVGGFDESFDYGSDIDFTWRLREAGHRLRLVVEATVTHDAGSTSRQLKRAFRYGQARARLYVKHPRKLVSGPRRDPILFAYPIFLLLLPSVLIRRFRWFPALLLLPIWRGRHNRPMRTLADHLVYGAGALAFLLRVPR